MLKIMNKRALSEVLWNNVLYLIILIFFIIGIFMFISDQWNGAAIREDYYAKEIVRIINLAEPGDVVTLNVQKATEIGKKNNVDFNDMFRIDNEHKEICVRLSSSRRTCYSYFNDVSIDKSEVRLGVPENILYFEVRGK